MDLSRSGAGVYDLRGHIHIVRRRFAPQTSAGERAMVEELWESRPFAPQRLSDSVTPRFLLCLRRNAMFEAGASMMAGASAATVIGRYREHVAANARRLSAI
jgi:hypothetical protein